MPGPELVAVQREPRLEAERVAGAQTGRGDALGEHGIPEARRHLGGHGALDAVLARVAGAGHEAGGPAPLEALDVEAMHRGSLGRDPGQALAGLGTLHGDHRPLAR